MRGGPHSAPRMAMLLGGGVLLALLGCPADARAQELEPRAYASSPVGVNFFVVATARSSGGVVVDPSLPIEDVEASVVSVAVGAGRTFDLLGRTALFTAAVPYAWVDASGQVGEAAREVSRNGLAAPRLKFSVNLLGGKARPVAEFVKTPPPRFIVGTSLVVAPPIGQYDRTKLINIAANRWSFKPEVGVSRLAGKWTIDAYAGVWFFTANDEFYPGEVRRTQKPIVSLQGHASYTMRPRLWIAGNATWYSGGTTSLDGVPRADLQRNSRIGATLSLPLVRRQSLKLSASTGATTRIGANFRTFGVAWQTAWFD